LCAFFQVGQCPDQSASVRARLCHHRRAQEVLAAVPRSLSPC
jgi:hypothetical protein